MYIIPNTAESIREWAASLVSDYPYAPQFQCDACGREINTYEGAHDDAVNAVIEFVEHTAYDHSDRATILQVTVERFAQVAVPCTGRNGTYTCSLDRGHEGVHVCRFMSKGMPMEATFANNYSDVHWAHA